VSFVSQKGVLLVCLFSFDFFFGGGADKIVKKRDYVESTAIDSFCKILMDWFVVGSGRFDAL
jgi:hypothetical protein